MTVPHGEPGEVGKSAEGIRRLSIQFAGWLDRVLDEAMWGDEPGLHVTMCRKDVSRLFVDLPILSERASDFLCGRAGYELDRCAFNQG